MWKPGTARDALNLPQTGQGDPASSNLGWKPVPTSKLLSHRQPPISSEWWHKESGKFEVFAFSKCLKT
jgi:hypothetical protein